MASEGAASDGAGSGLSGFLSGLWGAVGSAARAAGTVNPLGELPALPEIATHPGAMSAAQFNALRATLTAQRDSIAAMQSQLTAFDEQLQVLERLLGPVAEWSAAWARVESGIVPGPRPAASRDDAD